VMAVRSRVVDRAAGVLLLAGALANFAGVIMFSIRGGPSEMAEELFPSWGSGAASLAFLGAERGLLMAAMVLSALGFCLLDGRPYRPGTYVFMRLGVTAYLASSIIGVVAETLELTSTAVYPMFVVYVTLAFVSQATIGCALATSELIPRWIGWATAIWNLAWLAIRPALGHLLPDPSLGDARVHRCRADPAARSRECTRSGPRRHPGRLS
jgi:hypothetical protein